jgi:hypothetical protein
MKKLQIKIKEGRDVTKHKQVCAVGGQQNGAAATSSTQPPAMCNKSPALRVRHCEVSKVLSQFYKQTNLTSPEIFLATVIKVKRYKFGLRRLEVSMFITILTSSRDVHSKVA